MRIGRVAIVAVLSLALLLVGGFGILMHSKPDAAAVLPSLRQQSDAGSTSASALQAKLARDPSDSRSWAALGIVYVQTARRTGDPSLYSKAQGALDRSRALKSDSFELAIGMSSLAAARHDFAAAFEWGARAQRTGRHTASAYGVTGDALVELGRYPEAFRTLQRMIDLRPDLSSYARASYARELQGDVPGAIEAMKLALEAASSRPDAAWAGYQLGELWFNSGQLDRAEEAYARAAGEDPSYVPARQGLAKVAAARGKYARAMSLYASVIESMPLPQYVIEAEDVATAAGKPAAAAEQAALLRVEERLARANGVNLDLEIAIYSADHGQAASALQAARAEWGRRHSIFVADALAWALYVNGQYAEAREHSVRALALGTRNALFWFHRGMIERALGHPAVARAALRRALAINPAFSVVWAPVAVRTVAALGRAS